MKHKHSRLSSILRGLGIFLVGVILLLYIGLPVGLGIAAVLPSKTAVGQPPPGFEEVALQAEDGVQLKAWYRPPAGSGQAGAGTVIVLIHGAGGSRENMRPYAEILVRHGYGVLALDLRGHGDSQGKTNRLGWQGTLDVGAAVRFLQNQKEVEHIAGLGSSMGGEVLLGAASAYPALQAIVADGATRRSTPEYLALESNRPLVRSFTARLMFATVQLLTGDQPPLPLLDSMRGAESTRFLLVAAGENALETSYNQLFVDTLGSRAALWLAPGAQHTGALALYPAEYEQRVISFYQSVFPTSPETAAPKTFFAPYLLLGSFNANEALAANLDHVILAFVQHQGTCDPAWADDSDLQAALAEVEKFKKAGGSVTVSFGGWREGPSSELAYPCKDDPQALVRQYQAVLDQFGAQSIDFDIEMEKDLNDQDANAARNQAIRQLQDQRGSLVVSYTFPVTESGLNANALNILKNAASPDIQANIHIVNLMTMDYGGPNDHMGQSAIQAAESVFQQLKTLYPQASEAELWSRIGITPMIGANDHYGYPEINEIFTPANAREVKEFADRRRIGRLSFWALPRDQSCPNQEAVVSYACSGIVQQPLEFTCIFQGCR